VTWDVFPNALSTAIPICVTELSDGIELDAVQWASAAQLATSGRTVIFEPGECHLERRRGPVSVLSAPRTSTKRLGTSTTMAEPDSRFHIG
jgi:hypothetical protein